MFDYEYWQYASLQANVNMALEEYFLERAAAGKACLRLWDVPSDSAVIGYSQDTDILKQLDRTFSVVRRASGGSHIQIGQNILAYTVTVPRDGTFGHYEDMRAYYANKVANSLENVGIGDITVDNKASTINVNGKVIASHAIVWGVHSALLHGLIIIDPYDVDKLSGRLRLGSRKIGSKTYTEHSALKNIPAVSKLLDKTAKDLSQSQRTEALKNIMSQEILKEISGNNFENKLLDKKVFADAYSLIRQKYGQEKWTNLRRPPFKREQIEEIPGEKLDGPLKKDLGYCLYIQVKNKDFKKMAEPII